MLVYHNKRMQTTEMYKNTSLSRKMTLWKCRWIRLPLSKVIFLFYKRGALSMMSPSWKIANTFSWRRLAVFCAISKQYPFKQHCCHVSVYAQETTSNQEFKNTPTELFKILIQYTQFFEYIAGLFLSVTQVSDWPKLIMLTFTRQSKE